MRTLFPGSSVRVRWLASLLLLVASPAPAADLMLRASCMMAGGSYGPWAQQTFRVGPGFELTLPAATGCLQRFGPSLILRLDVPQTEADPSPHVANLVYGRLDQPVWGAPFATLSDLRRILEQDAAAITSPGGSGVTRGQILRYGSGPGIRVLDIQVDQDIPEQQCIPVRSLVEHRDLLPGLPPGSIAEIRAEDRFCVAGEGEGINVNFVEITLSGDRGSAARGAQVRALASELFASIRATRAPADPAPRGTAAPSHAAEHCRLAHRGRFVDGRASWALGDFRIEVPPGGFCDLSQDSPPYVAIREDRNLWRASRPDPQPSEADQFYRLALFAFRLGPDAWRRRPEELQRIADLRQIVEALAARERSGASHVYAPPTPFGRATLRSIEVGANLPGCVPLRVTHAAREQNPILPATVQRFRSEWRYCLGPNGVTAVLRVAEQWIEGDPHAEPRMAEAERVAQAFFASLRWAGPGAPR